MIYLILDWPAGWLIVQFADRLNRAILSRPVRWVNKRQRETIWENWSSCEWYNVHRQSVEKIRQVYILASLVPKPLSHSANRYSKVIIVASDCLKSALRRPYVAPP